MATKVTPSRRKFCDAWDEIEYLYHKILHWFYPLRDRRRAFAFCKRLKVLLQKVASQHESIFGEECWSLFYEVKGDLQRAIKYRESEINLIKHLWEISRGTPEEGFIFKQYDASDLSDRMDLLAILHHEAGHLDKAISLLRESEQFCKRHGIRFDGKDLLRDYIREKKHFGRDAPARAAKRSLSSA